MRASVSSQSHFRSRRLIPFSIFDFGFKIGASLPRLLRGQKSLRLRFAQTEETSRLVERRDELQSAIVRPRFFKDGLPIRQTQVRRGFEKEAGRCERPGKGEGGIASRKAKVNASGGAGIQ